jgi:hypothetical protein
MSGSLLRAPRWNVLAACAVAAGMALATAARADDIDDYTASAAVKVQKALREINGLIAEARKLEASNPTRARGLLREARYQLDGTAGIPESDRTALVRQINSAVRSVEAAVRERNGDAEAATAREDQRRREEARRRELEAQKKQNGRYARAQDMINTGKGALSAYERLKQKREAGVLQIDREVMESASRITEERITERFIRASERAKPKLTKAEIHLLKMLNSTLSVNFDKMPLKDAIEYLHDKTDINIFVDENSLKDANVEYDDPVSFKARKVTVRTILKKILADKGLTFIIKEAAVQVMTPEKAKQFMVVRAYPIADLLPLADPRMGPGLNRMQMLQSAQGIINLIVTTVEPESWKFNGGTGTIAFDPTTMTLVIRQTAEFHYQMGGFLSR